jgi:Tol biopolymer transport system component
VIAPKRVLAAMTAAGLLLEGACAGGVRTQDLPASPIALLHRMADEARRRAEIISEASGKGPSTPTGFFRPSDVQKILGKDVNAEFADLSGHLSMLNPRTGEIKVVDSAPKGAEPMAYSPDRQQLVFRVRRADSMQLMLLDIGRNRLQPLTPSDVFATSGALSSDGRLVYSAIRKADTGPTMRLFLQSPGAGAARPLTGGPVDGTPVFSPDGSLVVFVAHSKEGADEIARLDPREDDPVTRIIARGRDPVFVPDGAWIVYSALVGREHHLWKMRPDGSGKLPLGAGPTETKDEVHPAVSPDGNFVAYVSELEGRSYLRVRRIDCTGDRSLLDEGDGAWPVW